MHSIMMLLAWTIDLWLDRLTVVMLSVVMSVLGIAYLVGALIQRQPDSTINPAVVHAFNMRVRAWWLMFVILTAAFLLGPTATVVLFFLVSFWALREFITLTPTRKADHMTLFWVFVFSPVQYLLIAQGSEFYGLYSIVIPVYVYLFIPARIAMAGDYKRFLERAAKIQAGILICVYALSYAPALLYLNYQTTTTGDPASAEPWTGSRAGVLFYLILIVQIGDVTQYIWSRYAGRRIIAPEINASRTWEGFFGGVLTTSLVGSVLHAMTPFNAWEAAFVAMVTAVMGFAGGMTMSAIKRDRGVKDYGTLVEGHAGILDRVDSLCFAAPVFFHLTRFWFTKLA